MTRNRLKLNDDKADLLLIYSTRANRKPSLDLKLPNRSCCLTPSDSVWNLGVALDSQLTMERHVFAEWSVFILDLSSVSVGFSTALQPEHLCMPLYCQDSITAMLYFLACLENLLIVFRECKMQQRGWSSEWRGETTSHQTWLSSTRLSCRIKIKILVLFYKCMNGLAPVYLKELITIRRHSVNLRSGWSVLLHVPVTKKKGCGDGTFSRIDPLLWNELPPVIQTSYTLLSFF